MVVVHTISGFQEANEGRLAAELLRSGFATLTYDSFSARGLSQSAVVGSRTGPPLASGVADALAALQLLAGHPRIDADRIGIDGFSFGGEVAHLTAFEVLRAVMAPGSSRFAAHHVKDRMTLPSPSILRSTGVPLQHWGGTTDVRVPRDHDSPARRVPDGNR